MNKFIGLKLFSICQISLLAIPFSFFTQSHALSAEIPLTNVDSSQNYNLSRTDLFVADHPLNSQQKRDNLQPSNAHQNQESSHPIYPIVQDHHLFPHTQRVEENFRPDGSQKPQGTGSDRLPSPPVLELTTASLSLPSTPIQLHHTPSLSASATIFADRIAQVIEMPDPADSTGRRPSLRTEPTTPGEKPLNLRQELLIPPKTYSPSITILSPSAYGKSWRQASIGFGIQHRTRFTDSADGAFGMGFGLGDARKYVGLDVGLSLTDLDSLDRGIISFKIHRQLPDLFAVAVGVNDAIGWGNGDVNGPSPYGVITKTFILKEDTKDWFSRVHISAGAGTGRYRTESNIVSGSDTPGIFGSLAVRVADPINAIAEWSGQDLSLGVSLRPFRHVPIIITPAVTDITGTAGDGARFIVGVGYAISF
jgi:hypothetical protein